jgi:uncharacterized protein YkwD
MFHRAGFHIRGLVVVLATLCMLTTASAPVSAGGDPSAVYTLPHRVPSAQAQADLELLVLNLLNQERGEQGLPPLMPHAGLRSAARTHGVEMFTYGFLSHRSRDGRTLVQRLSTSQIQVRMVAENIAYARDVQTAHAALMDSDGHRKNILSPLFRLVGIAVIDGGTYGLIVVQDFADAPQGYAARGRPVAR